MTSVCRDACMMAMRRAVAGKRPAEIKALGLAGQMKELPVAMADFEQALGKVQSSVSQADLNRHRKWKLEFGAS